MKGLCTSAALVALTLALAAPAHAQELKPGERVFVTDRSGVQTEGRLLAFSPQELALLVDGHKLVIPASQIGRVEKGDSLWNGMLIGAAPFALFGGSAVGASCSPRCGRDIPLGMAIWGAIGSGLGALVDSRVRGYSILDGPPLASPNARGTPVPVPAIDELWMQVRQGDAVAVVTRSGQKVAGTFVQVSSTSVTLTVDGARRDIAASDVRRVTRAGNRHRSGALWGGTIGATIGLAAVAACRGDGCGNPLLAAMIGGSSGALWGTVIGATIPKHPAIYEADAPSATRVTPLIGPGRVGIAFSATF
jgi:hypothetical protein